MERHAAEDYNADAAWRIYLGTVVMGLPEREVQLMVIGEFDDLYSIHLIYNGQAFAAKEHYIDEITKID